MASRLACASMTSESIAAAQLLTFIFPVGVPRDTIASGALVTDFVCIFFPTLGSWVRDCWNFKAAACWFPEILLRFASLRSSAAANPLFITARSAVPFLLQFDRGVCLEFRRTASLLSRAIGDRASGDRASGDRASGDRASGDRASWSFYCPILSRKRSVMPAM